MLQRTTLAVPASARDAFRLYADLPLQPLWSPWLRSVRWVDEPRRESEWTLAAVPVSFVARDTTYDERRCEIAWERTARAPLRARGGVRFVDVAPASPTTSLARAAGERYAADAAGCMMTLSVELVTPPLIERALKASGVEFGDAMLAADARRFRDELARRLDAARALAERGAADGASEARPRATARLRAALDALAGEGVASGGADGGAARLWRDRRDVERLAAELERAQPSSARRGESARRRRGRVATGVRVVVVVVAHAPHTLMKVAK